MATYDWRDAVEHVDQGVHSGIPTCCVAFFVLEVLPINAIGRVHPHYQDIDFAGFGMATAPPVEWKSDGSRPHGYTPCPDCLASRRFVVLHECDASCLGKRGCSPCVNRNTRPSAEVG